MIVTVKQKVLNTAVMDPIVISDDESLDRNVDAQSISVQIAEFIRNEREVIEKKMPDSWGQGYKITVSYLSV